MRKQLTMWIVTGHLGFNIHPGKLEFYFTETGNIGFVQIQFNGDPFSFTRGFNPALEAFNIFFSQFQNRGQPFDGGINIFDIGPA